VVSNRLPLAVSRGKTGLKISRSSGGLVSALEPVRESRPLLWMGALPPMKLSSSEKALLLKRLKKDHSAIPLELSAAQWNSHYGGFSNSALWPLFHYFPQHCSFQEAHWKAYTEVNRRFAAHVLKKSRPGDMIWIHDYQLMLVPEMIRQRRPDANIGFFLHIPFPSSEFFRTLPWREELLRGVCGADLIGFHTYSYLRHFSSAVLHILGFETEMPIIKKRDREVELGVFPVGADAGNIEAVLKTVAFGKELRFLNESTAGRKLLIGVDRLDYTKGIPERLRAFHRFLELHPRWRGRVEYYQLLIPSRTEVSTYGRLKYEIDRLVGRVNGQFARPDWVPVRCFYRSMNEHELMALYARADAALVTPLRDGMNLVAKEFVLAQKEVSPGALILSEFCGAAPELSESLSVNPFNIEETVQAIEKALSMDEGERRRRSAAMYERIRKNDAKRWGESFLSRLEKVVSRRLPRRRRLSGDNLKKLESAWRKAKRRLVLSDYDGTLREIVRKPEWAAPGKELVRLLKRLSADARTELVIVSGRPRDTLEEWLGGVGCCFGAEHAAWIYDRKSWTSTTPPAPEWKSKIRPVLDLYAERVPGAFVEEKEEAVAWHYRRAEPGFGSWQANELVFALEGLIRGLPLECVLGKKLVEVRRQGVNKGKVWEWALKALPKFDLVLALGDDRTDEDLFQILPDSAWTIHVGSTDSRARYFLDSPAEIRRLLKRLAGRPTRER